MGIIFIVSLLGSEEILKDSKVLHKKVVCKYRPTIAKHINFNVECTSRE